MTQELNKQSEEALKKKRIMRTIAASLLIFLMIPVVAMLQVQYFGIDSFIFLALFNVNLVIVLLILFVVIRNGIKLLLEKRNKVLGSNLKTKLVGTFMGLTIIPCALMFLISTKFVQISVDFWFQEQVEQSINSALEVGQIIFQKLDERLEKSAQLIDVQLPLTTTEATNSNETSTDNRAELINQILETQKTQLHLSFIAEYSQKNNLMFWSGENRFEKIAETALNSVGQEALNDRGFYSLVISDNNKDFSVGILKRSNQHLLVFGENLGFGFKEKLEQISSGVKEYKRLKKHKLPLKWMLYLSLGIVSMLIILGAMWIAFKIAQSLTSPVQLLVDATERISKGDLSVRITETYHDELGSLIHSFNKMGGDLELNQTKLKEQALALEQHSQYITTVLDNIASGVISLNHEGKVTTANKVALDLFKLSEKEFIGHYIHEFLSEEEIKTIKTIQTYLSRKNRSWKKQVTLHIGDKNQRLLISADSLKEKNNQDSGIVIVFEDIAELERMQRMEAWREVAKRVAHEIKNPLTPIKLSAERLQRKFGREINDPAFAQCTGVIVRQVENMQSMVQEFSAFAKVPEVVLKETDLIPILNDTVTLFKNSHQHIKFICEYPETMPHLYLDADAIQRAFINIIQNAVDALDNAENPEIKIICTQNKQNYTLNIDFIDNGSGISPEEQERIFEPYFSMKKSGTGLGLTIVRSIINDHKGYIKALDNDGKGLIIRVELPLN
ncbi:sensor histidine kinase [Desulfovibrio litoralis]|uniref:histidine kinase n=1 Tax=Desulfovibrio litoralis DSM 11393 TaxID=1121455 RepID=A0A1M7TB20_9BACT|nr:ATP-binding protein [Desulfovibrio litoralis]SHN67912.1 two-component system, NtrC family, nitrogen regulation sensor histidine kinase NtrY [Desulfovibrio litoralis DSM 11393]